jgi:hypothetical protein
MDRRFFAESEGLPDLPGMMLAVRLAEKEKGIAPPAPEDLMASASATDDGPDLMRSQASDEATRDGATAIDLIDGDRLCNPLKENRLGVSTQMIESVSVDPAWFASV